MRMARRSVAHGFALLAAMTLLVAVIMSPCRQTLGLTHSGPVKRSRAGIGSKLPVSIRSFGNPCKVDLSGSSLIKGEIDTEVEDESTFAFRSTLAIVEIPSSLRPGTVRELGSLSIASPSRPLRC